MAGKGGGAWKVAYADFVTAMMAFFLVMWIVAQNKPAKEAIAGYFRDPSGKRMGTRGAGSAARSAMKRPDAPPVDPRKTGDDAQGTKNGYQGRPPTIVKSRLPTSTFVGRSIAFAGDSTELDEQARKQLAEAAPALLGKSNRIEIRAHMSRVADASAVDVWQICYRRCVAAMKFLEEQGVEPDRIRLSLAGANDPVAPSSADDWAERNSRIEVFLTNEFVSRRTEAPADAPTDSAASPRSGH